jgi:hypothetical protein
LFDRSQNLLQHAIGVLNNVIIPKSQNEITLRFQHRSPILITCLLLVMLSAIKLDDELGVSTAEVGNEAINRHLSLELPTSETAIAQSKPEQPLCIGLSPTQTPR